jgi:two-component system response regulator RegX3
MSNARLRVLLVDDEIESAELMRDVLASTGEHSILLAGSGEEALDRLRSDPPYDILVTDIGLPGMSGLAMLEVAAQDGLTAGVVVVVCSANMELLPRALALGARCIAKPVYAREIVEAVRIRHSQTAPTS